MMKFVLSISVVVILFSACSKDESNPTLPAPTPTPLPGISQPPGVYTKKTLLEYHTAAWCSTCPDAEVKRDQVMNAYPGKVIPVAIHQSDEMQIPLFMTLDATFSSNPAYGMNSRTPSLNNVLLNRTQWMTNVYSSISVTAKCGLAINSTYTGNTANIEVQAAFRESLSGTNHLTVYIIEDEVTGNGSGYDQANSYNTDPTSPYYNLGNPITSYKHRFVVRKVITANLGDLIDPSKHVADGLFKKNFTVDLTGMVRNKVEIVAFVNKIGESATTHEVVNVQKAKLGALKNWD